LDGIPTFPDTTCYAINQEDSYGDNTIIRDNVIIDGYHGILIRGYSAFVENNIIHNMDGHGIVVYDQESIAIRGNYLHRAGLQLFGTSGHSFSFVQVSANTFIDSGCDLSNSGYDVDAHGNFFIDVLPQVGTRTKFNNNTIRFINARNDIFFDSYKTFKNNVVFSKPEDMDAGVKPIIYVQGTELSIGIGNEFKNMEFRYNGTSNTTFIVDNCTFTDCKISNQTSNQSVHLKNCTLVDSFISPNEINGTVNSHKFTLTNCTIESNKLIKLIDCVTNVNGGATTVTLDKCNMTIKNSDFVNMFTNVYSTSSINGVIKNSTIEYTGSPSLLISCYASDNIVNSSVISNNKFNNIGFKSMSGAKYLSYDPLTRGTSEPTSGYFSLGDVYQSASPVSGSYLGWVCTTEGIANNSTWTSKTYAIGDKINANGYVYEAQTAGSSSTSAPTFPTTIGNTVVDNGVTWKNVGAKAVFKQYGLIQ
jgi:hypothetical protein